jgi:formiminoglutamate deiminase
MAAAIAAAAAETGIRLTLLPVFYAHADFGGAPALPQQARFVSDLESFARLLEGCRAALASLDDARLGVAPHSLRAVTEAELAAVTALLPGAPIHIHVSEQLREVEACLAWSGQRPIDWLFDHAEVDARWCLVHATHGNQPELARVLASEAVVGLCPITEANLGDGIFPARSFLAAGGRIGIGSDSNVLISAAEELRLLEYGQRLTHHGRNLLASGPGASTGSSLWRDTLSGGAQALGADGRGLFAGAPADLISLDDEMDDERALDRWIFAGTAKVDCVWRGGAKRIEGGRHMAREAISQRYRQALRKMMA